MPQPLNTHLEIFQADHGVLGDILEALQLACVEQLELVEGGEGVLFYVVDVVLPQVQLLDGQGVRGAVSLKHGHPDELVARQVQCS